MKLTTSYKVKIKHDNGVLQQTVNLYRQAEDYFIELILKEWDLFANVKCTNGAQSIAEQLSISTEKHPDPKYDFDKKFVKFPSYLRRAVINKAYGAVKSYKTRLASWEDSDPMTRGAAPGYPKSGYSYPTLYKGNMYEQTGTYTAKIKVWIRNTWDWLELELKKGDVDYIRRRCKDRKVCAPTLQKTGKEWFLTFPFEENVTLPKVAIMEQKILAVDLGINSACTCVIMRSDGAVLGRHFLSLPKEYDCLQRRIDRIKRAQRCGSRCIRNLWLYADNTNQDIAVKTAQYIVDIAMMYNVDTIVFEHLDLHGKKRGSKKQKLALWRARSVQDMAMLKAHRAGIRVNTVNAWGTSRLAFDGSGEVLRGKDAGFESYSICRFTTGKIYNCDLNAAYNIGSRYFVREISKTIRATRWQRIAAKVPGCAKRSTCVLATLISLNAELYAAA